MPTTSGMRGTLCCSHLNEPGRYARVISLEGQLLRTYGRNGEQPFGPSFDRRQKEEKLRAAKVLTLRPFIIDLLIAVFTKSFLLHYQNSFKQ